jgi:transcriptional regulator with XRE-family HTH domain
MIHERLLDIIQYKTSGKQADFAEIMGWSPQYLNRLTKGESGIGIRPIVALLEKFPELNARWLLLGEGAMITSAADEVRKRLARLLEIEKYMPVMTPDELREVTEGDCQFDLQTVNKWNTLLEKRNKETNDRFSAAYKRQEELCRQDKAR